MPPKILLIAYKFPPLRSVGSLRNYQLARQWVRRGYEVHVLTTSNRHELPQQPLPDIPGLQVHEIPTFDFRTFLARLSSGGGGRSPRFSPGPLLDFLRKLKESRPLNLLLDEGGPLYLYRGYRLAADLVQEHDIRFLYSSFRPYADHVIARRLCRRFPRLRWLADFRDPHVDRNRRNVFLPAWQERQDRRLVQPAEVVTTVSRGIAEYLQPLHPNIRVLRNGIGELPGLSAEAPALPEAFCIAYTGSLYPRQQSAELLLRALRRLLESGKIPPGKLRLTYAGSQGEIWRKWVAAHGLLPCLHDLGRLPLPESLALQRAAQLNLLLSWAGPVFSGILTGKLYEYLASGRPILALLHGPGADPELEDILRRTGAGRVFYSREKQIEKLEEFLWRHYRAWEAGKPLSGVSDELLLAPYRWDGMMESFMREVGWP